MFDYIKKSIHAKILILIVSIMALGAVTLIYWALHTNKRDFLKERVRASRLMARPVLDAIDEDMIEERPDLTRKLLDMLSLEEGVALKIIRRNGAEEAFMDMKTVEEVRKVYGRIKPEWVADHPREEKNIAVETATAGFKKAYGAMSADWKQNTLYYIEKRAGKPFLTYLSLIEKKPACSGCHSDPGPRGILMISTPLDDMYLVLSKKRNQWFFSGVFAVVIGGVLISVLIKRSITGPIGRSVDMLKRFADGEADISERAEVTSDDEMGYLTSAFNSMLDSIQKRDADNKRLFRMVEKSKEEWVATFDSIQDLISIHDREDRIIRVNKALARKFNTGPETLINRHCKDLFYAGGPGHDRCPHIRTLATGEVMDVEVDDLAIEGTYRITTFPIFNDEGGVSAAVHVARDVTLEKLLREQLLHAEKLSSMGKLVAGIAHELNNPLMGIMGFSQILLDTPGDSKVKDIKEKLEKIYHESMRTAKIVQNLLTFARAKKTERAYTDINEVLHHTKDLREYSLKANNIEVRLDLDEGLPATMVDKYQLQQVFINLINNAEDAMVEASGGGTLEIKTKKKGGKIEITFVDDGPGIAEPIIHKVFDPFFTTKEVGKGTGLGLSITHGIITEHGGEITMENHAGGGAVVTITLPIVGQEIWKEVTKAFTDAGEHDETNYGQRILIVDDETSIRESLSGILGNWGFIVDSAANGREALKALKENDYSLVITDIKMPGVNGIELFNEIARSYPGLKDRVIILTGDVFSKETKDFLSANRCPYFLKPFEPSELMTVIKKVLFS